MITLNRFITTLLCAALLQSTLTLLLPEGSIKRYAQFVFGLIMLTLMLRPLLHLLT